MTLEAVWCPVACKVVFRDPLADNDASESGNRNKNQQQQQTQKDHHDGIGTKTKPEKMKLEAVKKEKEYPVEWRQSNPNLTEMLPERTKSRGISAKKFHKLDKTTLRKQIRQHYVRQLSTQQRNAYKLKLSAFFKTTEYKVFPLQSPAIEYLETLKHLTKQEEQQTVDGRITPLPHSSTGLSSVDSSASDLLNPPKKTQYCKSSNRNHCNGDLTESDYTREFQNQWQQYIARTYTSDVSDALWCMEPRVFAIEVAGGSSSVAGSGRRKYAMAHMGRYLDLYWRQSEPRNRHGYELIRPNTPCRLYLDIEGSCKYNPELLDIADDVMRELYLELQTEFATILDPSDDGQPYLSPLERSDIIDLDSSTDAKFSRHWIVHLRRNKRSSSNNMGEPLFANSASVGAFVRNLVSRLAEAHATGRLQKVRPALARFLFVKTKSSSPDCVDDKPTCIIDLGVYTKNRLFRLLGSSKLGKPLSAVLRIAKDNRFPLADGKFSNATFYPPNMEPVDPNNTMTQLDIDEVIKKRISLTDWSPHAHALAETLVVPIKSTLRHSVLPFNEPVDDPNISGKSGGVNKRLPNQNQSLVRHGMSPYRMIDDFVYQELATIGGTQGTIRAYTIDHDNNGNRPVRITFQMSRNRWCECVQREHKSNNIAWTVDLVDFRCTQSCHDPDCRALGFRGIPVPLPGTVVEAFEDALFEEDLNRIDVDKVVSRPTSVRCASVTADDINEFSDDELDAALNELDVKELCAFENPPQYKQNTTLGKSVNVLARPQKNWKHNMDFGSSSDERVGRHQFCHKSTEPKASITKCSSVGSCSEKPSSNWKQNFDFGSSSGSDEDRCSGIDPKTYSKEREDICDKIKTKNSTDDWKQRAINNIFDSDSDISDDDDDVAAAANLCAYSSKNNEESFYSNTRVHEAHENELSLQNLHVSANVARIINIESDPCNSENEEPTPKTSNTTNDTQFSSRSGGMTPCLQKQPCRPLTDVPFTAAQSLQQQFREDYHTTVISQPASTAKENRSRNILDDSNDSSDDDIEHLPGNESRDVETNLTKPSDCKYRCK